MSGLRFGPLTSRERKFAECLGSGLSNQQIALRLSLSRATVNDHVHRILAKTGLQNCTAIALAWRGAGDRLKATRASSNQVQRYSFPAFPRATFRPLQCTRQTTGHRPP